MSAPVLPQTAEELRDMLVTAWNDGWRSYCHSSNQGLGTREFVTRPKLLEAFLRSYDLEPAPPPPRPSLREAIQKLGETDE